MTWSNTRDWKNDKQINKWLCKFTFDIKLFVKIYIFCYKKLRDKNTFTQVYVQTFWIVSSICSTSWYCTKLTPLSLHIKTYICTVIGINSLTVCILIGEISIFHSRAMGLYSSNCKRFFVCRAHTVNWEPLGQFTSNKKKTASKLDEKYKL
jgi:hypothetical protein